jgi:hypothetical protein
MGAKETINRSISGMIVLIAGYHSSRKATLAQSDNLLYIVSCKAMREGIYLGKVSRYTVRLTLKLETLVGGRNQSLHREELFKKSTPMFPSKSLICTLKNVPFAGILCPSLHVQE